MWKKDAVSNVFFKDPVRVADLLNGYVYRGKQVVRKEDVQNRGERVYRIEGQERKIEAEEVTLDVVNEVFQRMQVTIVCLQNQSKIHYAMPVRVMNEEAARYHEEWKAIADSHRKDKDVSDAEFISGFTKDDRLIPVITIVIYWGKKPWDGPRSLKDILELERCPLELQRFIVDYPIHLLDVREYNQSDQFMSDIRYVFGFLKRDADKEELAAYVEKNKKIFSRLKESTYNLLSVMSRCYRLKVVKKKVEKEGEYDMCKAIDGIYQDGHKTGRKEGRKEGRREGLKEGRKRGVEEGERKANKKALFLILGKFGKISDELRKRIQGEANVTVLDTWLLIAAKASSLEEFVQSMNSSMSV